MSLNDEMADTTSTTTKGIPSAAQRYYTQPRVGNVPATVSTVAPHRSIELQECTGLAEGRQILGDEEERKRVGKGEERHRKGSETRKTSKTWNSRKRSRSASNRSTSSAHFPIRQSQRLIKKRAAALEKLVRERLFGRPLPSAIKSSKRSRQFDTATIPYPLPALSEDPTTYNSSPADCRFHLPTTIEDRLAVRAALTPTLFRLQKKGWRGVVVWSPDASYIEASQVCLEAYYKFELLKRPDFSPFDLPSVLTLLPWYGKIGNFRNSPNWPKGW